MVQLRSPGRHRRMSDWDYWATHGSHKWSTHGRTGCTTHYADVVEQTVLHERLGEAAAVAARVAGVAPAHGAEDPREVDAGAAAREEEVVVELVLLARRALQRRALDREDDRRVVLCEEDVPAEAVRGVLPAEREALERASVLVRVATVKRKRKREGGGGCSPRSISGRCRTSSSGRAARMRSPSYGRAGRGCAGPRHKGP